MSNSNCRADELRAEIERLRKVLTDIAEVFPENHTAAVMARRALGGEMSRRHDDVHYPLQGRGKRANRKAKWPETTLYPYPPDWPRCPVCRLPALSGHITCGKMSCDERLKALEGK